MHASLLIDDHDDQYRKVLCWTKEGIDELSKIIQTDEAKEHRKQTLVPIDTIYQALMDLRPHIELNQLVLDSQQWNRVFPKIPWSKIAITIDKNSWEEFSKGEIIPRSGPHGNLAIMVIRIFSRVTQVTRGVTII